MKPKGCMINALEEPRIRQNTSCHKNIPIRLKGVPIFFSKRHIMIW
jgi:hypothetical protein